jgi:hypothetical protein
MIIGTQLFLTGFIADLLARDSGTRRTVKFKETINLPGELEND